MKILATAALVLALMVPAFAQDSPLGIDVLGGFGRGFEPGERISFTYDIRPVFDLGMPINIGFEVADGPSAPAEWSVLFDRHIARVKFGVDTSWVDLSVKIATALREGTELTENWYALTVNYKPNIIKGAVWSHLSIVAEPTMVTLAHKPDYFKFKAGVRVAF